MPHTSEPAANLKQLLDNSYQRYNSPVFIINDPVSIPHSFRLQQDIEISGFFAAILAWGQRPVIIKKCRELMNRMDNAPFAFIREHQESDLKKLLGFKHRTFNDTDLLYLIHFLHHHYSGHQSLETAFTGISGNMPDQKSRLEHFYNYVFSLPDAPYRTRKHISTPARKSACKRINMYLRWMVRKDEVDFGLWKQISPADLICPCDVHVIRVAGRLGLINRRQVDWEMALELTNNLRKLDATDPVKYDLSLFGLGVEENYKKIKLKKCNIENY